MEAQVIDDPAEHRFKLQISADDYASAYYRQDGEHLVLIHTQVPSEYYGQGIGSRLAAGTFELLRTTGRKAVLRCPFMVEYFNRHPEYADVIAG